MDAGLRSSELFEKRGWTTIVSDELVPNVLLLITLAITGLTGVFAHLLDSFERLSLTASHEPLVTPLNLGTPVVTPLELVEVAKKELEAPGDTLGELSTPELKREEKETVS